VSGVPLGALAQGGLGSQQPWPEAPGLLGV
jgi:hypothetical protein